MGPLHPQQKVPLLLQEFLDAFVPCSLPEEHTASSGDQVVLGDVVVHSYDTVVGIIDGVVLSGLLLAAWWPRGFFGFCCHCGDGCCGRQGSRLLCYGNSGPHRYVLCAIRPIRGGHIYDVIAGDSSSTEHCDISVWDGSTGWNRDILKVVGFSWLYDIIHGE